MLARARYPELFLAPEERTPDSFWISLRYFNLYRVALAGLFFSLSLVYGDALTSARTRCICSAWSPPPTWWRGSCSTPA